MMALKEASIIYIGYVVPFSAIIPLFIALAKYTKLPLELRVLTWYIAFSLCSSIIVSAMASNGVNNMPVIHAYTLCEFLLISLFYYRVYINTVAKKMIVWAAILYTVFFMADILFIESIYDFNNYNKTIESIIVILLSIFYFILSLDDSTTQTKSNTSISLAVSGILVYFSSSVLLFVVLNIDPQFINTQIIIWDIHASFLLLMFILFSTGLWKYR